MADGVIGVEGELLAGETKEEERMEVEDKDQELQGATFVLFCRLFCVLRIWCCIHVRFVLLVSSMYHSPKPPGVWPGRNPRLTERKASVPVVESPTSRNGTSRTSFLMSICCGESICLSLVPCFQFAPQPRAAWSVV